MAENNNDNTSCIKETEVKKLGNELNEEELDQASGGARKIYPNCDNSGGCSVLIVNSNTNLEITIPKGVI